MPMAAFTEGIVWPSGRSGDYLVLGNIVYSCVVIVVCLKAGAVVIKVFFFVTPSGSK
jgi:hypothetical protein